jgi:DNA-binding CsgD family transcriptional regulator
MAALVLTESKQSALRSLLAAEPVPGEPLPQRAVFDALAELVPCDYFGASLTDRRGRILQVVHLAPGPDRRTRVIDCPFAVPDLDEEDGEFRTGWVHWTRYPELAHECGGEPVGADDLAIGFRNGLDRVVQLNFVRQSLAFSDEALSLLRLLVPVLGRLTSESPAPDVPPTVTPSERRVLGLVATGRSNPEIAETLCVAESTVRKHLENSYRKLGVSNRMAAVARLHGSGPEPDDRRGGLERFA